MSTLTYPSDQFPAYPRATMECPDGWSPLAAPQAQLAVGLDVEEGQFRPNVVVVFTRMLPEHSLEATTRDALSRVEGLTEYEEILHEETDVAGFPGVTVEYAWRDERAGTVAQALRMAVVEHGPVRDLVQITGTCRGTQTEVVWPWIRRIQDSVRIEG